MAEIYTTRTEQIDSKSVRVYNNQGDSQILYYRCDSYGVWKWDKPAWDTAQPTPNTSETQATPTSPVSIFKNNKLFDSLSNAISNIDLTSIILKLVLTFLERDRQEIDAGLKSRGTSIPEVLSTRENELKMWKLFGAPERILEIIKQMFDFLDASKDDESTSHNFDQVKAFYSKVAVPSSLKFGTIDTMTVKGATAQATDAGLLAKSLATTKFSFIWPTVWKSKIFSNADSSKHMIAVGGYDGSSVNFSQIQPASDGSPNLVGSLPGPEGLARFLLSYSKKQYFDLFLSIYDNDYSKEYSEWQWCRKPSAGSYFVYTLGIFILAATGVVSVKTPYGTSYAWQGTPNFPTYGSLFSDKAFPKTLMPLLRTVKESAETSPITDSMLFSVNLANPKSYLTINEIGSLETYSTWTKLLNLIWNVNYCDRQWSNK